MQPKSNWSSYALGQLMVEVFGGATAKGSGVRPLLVRLILLLISLNFPVGGVPSNTIQVVKPVVVTEPHGAVWQGTMIVPTVLHFDLHSYHWTNMVDLVKDTCSFYRLPTSGYHAIHPFLSWLCDCNHGKNQEANLTIYKLSCSGDITDEWAEERAHVFVGLEDSHEVAAVIHNVTHMSVGAGGLSDLLKSNSTYAAPKLWLHRESGQCLEEQACSGGIKLNPTKIASNYTSRRLTAISRASPRRTRRFIAALLGLAGLGTGAAALVEVGKLRAEIEPVLKDIIESSSHEQKALVSLKGGTALLLRKVTTIESGLAVMRQSDARFRHLIQEMINATDTTIRQLEIRTRELISFVQFSALVQTLYSARAAIQSEHRAFLDTLHSERQELPPGLMVHWKEVEKDLIDSLDEINIEVEEEAIPLHKLKWTSIAVAQHGGVLHYVIAANVVFGNRRPTMTASAWPLMTSAGTLLVTTPCDFLYQGTTPCEVKEATTGCLADLASELVCFFWIECRWSQCCASLVKGQSEGCIVSEQRPMMKCYHRPTGSGKVYLSGECTVTYLNDSVSQPVPMIATGVISIPSPGVIVDGVVYLARRQLVHKPEEIDHRLKHLEIPELAHLTSFYEPKTIPDLPAWNFTNSSRILEWLEDAGQETGLAQRALLSAESELNKLQAKLASIELSLLPKAAIAYFALGLAATALILSLLTCWRLGGISPVSSPLYTGLRSMK